MTKKLDTTKCLIIRWTDEKIVVYAHYIQRTKLFYAHKDSLLNQTLARLLWALFSKGPQPWLIICRLAQTLTYFLTAQDPTPRVTPVTLSPCWENSRHLWFVQPTLKSLASVSQWVNPRGFTWTNTFPTFCNLLLLWLYSPLVLLPHCLFNMPSVGCLGGSVVKPLSSAQVMIPGTPVFCSFSSDPFFSFFLPWFAGFL